MRLLVLVAILLVACTGKSEPEAALKDYVNYRFSANQDKEDLLDKTHGDLRKDIEALSAEALEGEASDAEKFLTATEKYKKGTIKINLKKCSETLCNITYTLKYSRVNESNKSSKDSVLEIKKIATLENIDGSWKISRIENVKGYVQGRLEIGVPDKGTAVNPDTGAEEEIQ